MDIETNEQVDTLPTLEVLVSEGTVAETASEATVALSASEQAALEKGWKPQSEWQGEEEDFIPAKEFLRRGELFERINKDKRKLTDLEKQVQEMAGQFVAMQKTQYDKALSELKAQKKAAMREGDYEKVEELDTFIEEIKATPAPTVSQQPAVNPAFDAWTAANNWYGADADMTEDADALAQGYMNKDGATFPEMLKYVDARIAKLYPQKGPQATKKTVSKVSSSSSGSTSSTNSRKPTAANLTDTQRTIMRTMVNAGAFASEQEYVDELAKIGAI